MKTKIKNITLCGLMAAVICILTFITIPMPFGVPITMQTLAVALCGYFLGWKYGTCSLIVYILLGVVGLPVFSGFKGGFGVLFGPTGGFIWGFIIMVLACGLTAKAKNKFIPVIAGIISLAVCHLFGILQFSAVMGRGFEESFLIASAPFIIKDIISVAAAFAFSCALKKAMAKTNILSGI